MNELSRRYTDILLAELRDGRDMKDALLEVTRAHAAALRELGPVGVAALDPCPVCCGNVIADTDPCGVARCTGCGWVFRESLHG